MRIANVSMNQIIVRVRKFKLKLEKQIMNSIVSFDGRIRSSCTNGKDNKVDKQALFNQYYPPCIYDKGTKESTNPKNLPCLPYPDAPKPCNKNSKGPCLSKIKNKPCVKSNNIKSNQKIAKKTNLAYSVVSGISARIK